MKIALMCETNTKTKVRTCMGRTHRAKAPFDQPRKPYRAEAQLDRPGNVPHARAQLDQSANDPTNLQTPFHCLNININTKH